MVVARLSELAHTPAFADAARVLFPKERLDAFARSTGVDLRDTPTGVAAGFDYATLFLAETSGDDRNVEARFVDRLLVLASRSERAGMSRVTGIVGQTPESLVRAEGQFVAVSVGDPSLARVVELLALGRMDRVPPALRGSALSTLPRDLEAAPLRFYAPGPFSGEWARGARGLFAAALAIGVAAEPTPSGLRLKAVLSGDWSGQDVARLASSWADLAESALGRLLGLDQPISQPEVTLAQQTLTLTVVVALRPLASGLEAAVAADVWKLLGGPGPPPPGNEGAGTPGRPSTP